MNDYAEQLRAKRQAEYEWLKKPEHSHFRERPATVIEFLGPTYLNTGGLVSEGGAIRDAVADILADILGRETQVEKPTKYELAISTGAIGVGKSLMASITLTYLVHWCLCLKNPQQYFGLLSNSRIAFMLMSTKGKQVRDVLFGDIKEMIRNSPWFKDHPYDPSFKNEIRFDQNLWIIPGDSTETTFEGYNVLGGVIDEIDSHQVTPTKDYVEEGFTTIYGRMSSRYDDRGFLFLIGQMKKAEGFAARKFKEFTEREDTYAARMTIWESRGPDYYEKDEFGEVKSFYYDVLHKRIVPPAIVAQTGDDGMLKIPEMYRNQFLADPVKALRDLAGIPPSVEDPFFALPVRITEAQQAWHDAHPGQVNPFDADGRLDPSFQSMSTVPRAIHLDAAYASGGDAYGFAMGHISGNVHVDGEMKPVITFDCLLRLQALPGHEISFSEVRQIVYTLRALKFNIGWVTYDGLEGKDNEQQLRKKGFKVTHLSVDKTTEPYHLLKDAVYQNRCLFPRYQVPLRRGVPGETVDIVYRELSQLMDKGMKIDHPLPNGSKDVADAMAGVVSNLTTNRKLQRNVQHGHGISTTPRQTFAHPIEVAGKHHPAFRQDPTVVRHVAPIRPRGR